MTDVARISIDKLNNDNYQTWKYEAELILRRENTWSAVSVTKPDEHDASYAAWELANSKAIGTIGLLVEKGQHVHTKPAKTAREAWENLKKHHEKASLSSTVHMYVTLANKKLSENGDIVALLEEIELIVDNLVAVGEPVTDRFRIGMMLGNLPDSYGTLITALECRADADLTIGMVREKILFEFKRRKEGGEISVKNETALKIEVSDGKKTKSKTKATCFYCGKPGHFKSKCLKFKADKEKESKQVAKIATKVNSSDGVDTSKSTQFCFKTSQCAPDKWYIDSGATCHMTSSRDHFENLNTSEKEIVRVADGRNIIAEGIGTLRLHCTTPQGKVNDVTVKKVRYVPKLDGNLLSVRSLDKSGLVVTFHNDSCTITKGNTIVATADARENLYELNCSQKAMMTKSAGEDDCLHAWHKRFGHRDPGAVKRLEDDGLATGIKIRKCSVTICCDACVKGKMARLPFPKSGTKSKRILDLVHSDLCGPMQTQTPGGARYILTLIDDFSRYCTIYLLPKKSDASNKIKEFVQNCDNQVGQKPKTIRTDGGREYLSNELQSFFKQHGIEHQMTAPYTPQQNGVAERKNRSLVEMARCMLIDAGMSHQYWGEAVMTANYLQNRLPTRVTNTTPFKAWFGEKPDVKHVRTFGCKAYMHVPDERRRKLDNKALELTFVGYAEGSKAYRLLDLKSGRIHFSRDVKFVEPGHNNPGEQVEIQYFNAPESLHQWEDDTTTVETPLVIEAVNDLVDEAEEDVVQVPVTAENTRRVSSRTNKGIPAQRLVETCNSALTIQTDEPRTFKEAIAGHDRQNWEEAMREELTSLHHNKVWDLTELPAGKKAVGSKWIYKQKTDAEGKVNRYKARLVAQGFSQKYGMDYDEVFAPVMKNTTLKCLLAIAGKTGMTVRHYDVKTAFLNGELTDEVYMRQPEGYEVIGKEHLVCRLRKSIYGLKQSARTWNQKFNDVLLKNGFRRGEADQCVYSKMIDGSWMYVLIYVDDVILASIDGTAIERVEKILQEKFEITNLGNLHHYLGLHFERDKNGIFHVHQKAYIEKLLQRFGLVDAKSSKVPMDPGYFQRNEVDEMFHEKELYRQAIGSLLYVTVNSRPDIAVSVSILSRKVSNPSQADWVEVKRILRYLKETSNKKLLLGTVEGREETTLIGYADADWAGDTKDRKSNTGYVFMLYGGTVSWSSRKQQCVALSSTEAEYIALAEASQEAIWLQRLLKDLHQDISNIRIMEDNQSCLRMLDSEKMNQRSKHIDTKLNYAKDLKKSGMIQYQYCPTEAMVADILTKPLEAVKIRKFTELIGLF